MKGVTVDVEYHEVLRLKHPCGADGCDATIYGPTKVEFENTDGVLDYHCKVCGALYRARHSMFKSNVVISVRDTRHE